MGGLPGWDFTWQVWRRDEKPARLHLGATHLRGSLSATLSILQTSKDGVMLELWRKERWGGERRDRIREGGKMGKREGKREGRQRYYIISCEL